ncbi:MAG: DDE-type integrase/transposase/recombinase [Bacteroidales bacterium]|jgi:transposase InsO family protein
MYSSNSHEIKLKGSYDTLYAYLYSQGVRGKQYDDVPSSTLFDFKNRNYDSIIGFSETIAYSQMALMVEQNKELKKIIFSLLKLFCIYRNIIASLPGRNYFLFRAKDQIISCLQCWEKQFTINGIAKLLDIKPQHYTNWKKGYFCKFSPVSFCRKKVSGQLSLRELGLIKNFVLNKVYEKWSLSSIYYKMIRHSERYFSKSTFYKYVNLMGLRQKKIKAIKSKKGIRAVKPLQILHMDISEYWITDNIKAYFHIIIDNFSRKILGIKVADRKSASLALENLKEVYQGFNLNKHDEIILMINDSGSENKSITKEYIESLKNMKQEFTNRSKREFSNNLIEAAIKKLKQCYIYTEEYNGFDDFESQTYFATNDYNEEMTLEACGGRTPDEAFNDVNPFPDKLSVLIQKAKSLRIIENKYGECW